MNNNKRGILKNRIISVFLTVMVIGVLLMIKPAEAVTVKLTETSVSGGVYTYATSVDIHSDDYINVGLMAVRVTDENTSTVSTCYFNTTDSSISDDYTDDTAGVCDAVNVTAYNNYATASIAVHTGTAYGYGYGVGNTSFGVSNVTWTSVPVGYGFNYSSGYGYATYTTTTSSSGEIRFTFTFDSHDSSLTDGHDYSLKAGVAGTESGQVLYTYYNDANPSSIEAASTTTTTTTTSSTTTTTVSSSSGSTSSSTASSDPEGQIYTKLWSNVASGETITLVVARTDIPITELDITMGQDKDDLTVRVSEMDSKPSSVGSLDKTYKYMKIITNTESSGVSSANIKFSVPVSWFTDNGLSENDVALYRYVDGAWTELTTKVLGVSGDKINFEATTPGFSYFAIAEKIQSTVTTTSLDGSVTTTRPVVTTTQSGVTTTQFDVTTTPESTTTTISSGSGGVKPGVIVIIVVAILAVIAVVVTMTRRKKNGFDF